MNQTGPLPERACEVQAVMEVADNEAGLYTDEHRAELLKTLGTACDAGYGKACGARSKMNAVASAAKQKSDAKVALQEDIKRRADAILELPSSPAPSMKSAKASAKEALRWLSMVRFDDEHLAQAKQEIERAEEAVAKAKAEQAEDQRETEAMRREKPKIDEAKKLCNSRAACEKACEKGDQVVCTVLGGQIYAESKTEANKDKANGLFAAACAQGVEYGCVATRVLAQKWEADSAKMELSWTYMTQTIREIASMQHGIRKARRYPARPSPRREEALNIGQQEVERLKQARYCLARQDVVAIVGSSEFAKMARDHCEGDDAPTEDGSRLPDTPKIRTECREVIATQCPPTPVQPSRP